MRRLLLIVGVVCWCVSLTGAQGNTGKTANGWTCPKPSDAHSIEVGDKPGHAYTIDQITCTSTKGEIAGVQEKEGTGTEFADVTGNSMKGHGVFVETMANGDKIHFVYQFTGTTTKDGKLQSATDNYRAVRGAGKFKGIKASGTCTGTAKDDGSVDWACTGTYTLP
jgi:hypothetical protein